MEFDSSKKSSYIYILLFFLFFLNQRFIMWGAMANRGNYLVATVH